MRLPQHAERKSSAMAAGSQERPADEEEGRQTTERTALIADFDRHEERFYKLGPCESIYSFHLFMPAVEYRQTGKRCNYILGFALGLVLLNIAMQCVLMIVVSSDAIQKEDYMFKHLVHASPPWYQAHKHWQKTWEQEGDCAPESLCVNIGGKLSCGPRSLLLLDRWDLLDLDGDGKWSRTEVENQTHRAELRCRFGSDPLVLFESTISNLQAKGILKGRLHPELADGKAMHKAYFDWYLGEPMLCRHIDEDSCGNLFERGVFDEAIRNGVNSVAEITDLQSARKYCSNLLQNRCQNILPGFYHVWKSDALEMCGTKEFSTVTYLSPDKDPNNSMSHVTYQAPGNYQKYRSWIFMGYLAILLLTFFSTLLAEWKDIYRAILYCYQFPYLRGGSNDCAQRCAVLFVTLLRIIVWVVIGYGGTLLLTSKTDYLAMIFDALSLAFIVTIDELIYATMLRTPMKHAHQGLEALLLHRRRLCVSVHCLEAMMIVVVIGAAVAVAASYQWQELRPIHDALDCLCSVEGSTCRDASVHTKAWWDAYWSSTVPAASSQIDQLMRETL